MVASRPFTSYQALVLGMELLTLKSYFDHPSILGTSLLRPFSRQFLIVTIVSALRIPHILATSLLPFPMSSHLSPVFRVILLQQRSTAEKGNVGY